MKVTVRILTIDEQDRVDLTLVAAGGIPVEELTINSGDDREFSHDREGPRDYRDSGRSGYRDNRDSRERRGNDTRERRPSSRYDQRDNTRDFRNRRSPRIPKGRSR